MTGYCDHDHAEPPLDRERANFCQYFKPRPGAWTPGELAADRDARRELDSLFGKAAEETSVEDPGVTAGKPESDRARSELERLFGSAPEDDA